MIDREIFYSKKGNSVVAQGYKVGEKSVGKGPNQVTTYSGGKCQCLYTDSTIHTDVYSHQNSTDCILKRVGMFVHTPPPHTTINPGQVLLVASQTAMATEGLNMED